MVSTVLVVDDSEAARSNIRRILEDAELEIEILEAADGAEALPLALSGDVDIVVSDIVIHGDVPTRVGGAELRREDLSAWAGCIAGALTDREYADGLAEAGFQDISLEITRRYAPEDLAEPWPQWLTSLGEADARDIVGRFAATTVRARRLTGHDEG